MGGCCRKPSFTSSRSKRYEVLGKHESADEVKNAKSAREEEDEILKRWEEECARAVKAAEDAKARREAEVAAAAAAAKVAERRRVEEEAAAARAAAAAEKARLHS